MKEQLAFLHVCLEIGGRLRHKSKNYARGTDDRAATDSKRMPRTSLAEKHNVSRRTWLFSRLGFPERPSPSRLHSTRANALFRTFLYTMASRHYCLVFEATSVRRLQVSDMLFAIQKH